MGRRGIYICLSWILRETVITVRHIYQFVSQRKREQGNDEKWEQKRKGGKEFQENKQLALCTDKGRILRQIKERNLGVC